MRNVTKTKRCHGEIYKFIIVRRGEEGIAKLEFCPVAHYNQPIMPTPFTHLEIAQRLLDDNAIPQPIREALRSEAGAWLLGNVAADARVGSGVPREKTHFYAYQEGITEHPWRIMVDENPALLRPNDAAHQAFVAGYVAHLSVDEIWSLQMVGPHFAGRDWADRAERFYMLHIILIYMDERDLPKIADWQAEALCRAEPDDWLDFMSDNDLRHWQTLIYDQIKPGGRSATLDIFGGRINVEPAEMRKLVDSEAEMQQRLWDHVPKPLMHEVEAACYAHAREQVLRYMRESQ